ncbi:hypothetical protein [Metabacillus malikii]|uniref:Uncharacterized protein n=1 Tax=Metabacillus malikii TaxID=1504265 RepID=A0ABT9ZHC8_9BACI|nr:hypothetical protein [Metabacillus malikii]MDQ0231659.1 hypothetical protein [Metabacillus malikii]
MDKKTRQALEAIEKVKSPGDVVYEVFRTEKKSGMFQFLNILFESIPSASSSLMNDKVMYLLASEKSGKILEIENGVIRNTTEVPNWTSDQKDKFKKVTIDNHVYKKFKKIL